MHAFTNIRSRVVLPSVLAIALAACGGDDGPTSTTGTPPGVGTPSPSPTPTPTATPSPTPTPTPGGGAHGTSQDDMLAVMIESHNAARADVSALPVTLDPALNEAALNYAQELADTDTFRHSDRDDRPGQGENLWTGTKGAFSFRQMVDAWIDEKRFFVGGTFPDVSNTGKWQDVGHYTQIIWGDTSAIGCGLASNQRRDFLVCRYAPAGNVVGQRVPG